MRADTGPIGGDLSHEFIILAETGESQVYCHKDYLDFAVPPADTNFDDVEGIKAVSYTHLSGCGSPSSPPSR